MATVEQLLNRFRIEGLHKSRTIDIPIVKNRLILVGENGTGKSTVVNFMYLFLTCQWTRMVEYQFESVSAVINSEELTILRSDLKVTRDQYQDRKLMRFASRLPIAARREIDRLLHSGAQQSLFDDPDDIIGILVNSYGVSPSAVRDYLFRASARGEAGYPPNVREVEERVHELVTEQILFLPTYRRIEQDLRAIFPGLEEELGPRILSRVGSREERKGGYIEFVEFGMGDVDRQFRRAIDLIKESAHKRLNSLTATYLRDVIQGAYKSLEPMSKLKELDEAAIESMFQRTPEAFLSESNKNRLREILTKIKETGDIQDEDKVIAHFLTQLKQLYDNQLEDELAVRQFVEVCNDYLSGKKIVYDNLQFSYRIELEGAPAAGAEIKMRMLSSGEKQIVSLFSHIYLSGASGYFVIIDEPELSLSVPWQKRFLPNILGTGKCNGLVAVTHSPFVYQNELNEFAHSLEEFVEDYK